jgi:hypothetical protein
MAIADIKVLSLHEPTIDAPRNVPLCNNAAVLAAATAENIAVPASDPTAANFVRIAATDHIYVKFDGTATVPGDTTDGTASELIPLGTVAWYYVRGVANISVISAGTPVVTASFYQ